MFWTLRDLPLILLAIQAHNREPHQETSTSKGLLKPA